MQLYCYVWHAILNIRCNTIYVVHIHNRARSHNGSGEGGCSHGPNEHSSSWTNTFGINELATGPRCHIKPINKVNKPPYIRNLHLTKTSQVLLQGWPMPTLQCHLLKWTILTEVISGMVCLVYMKIQCSGLYFSFIRQTTKGQIYREWRSLLHIAYDQIIWVLVVILDG